MDFDESPELQAFRAEARAWLEANALPKGHPDDFSERASDDPYYVKRCKDWQGELARAGWAGITWPTEYGGRGGTSRQAAIFAEEQANFGVSTGVFAVGIGMAGPTIIAHGTEDQKQRFLPPLLRGQEAWCQLFSEPGAGSDLAGLATRAERVGDDWIVNGQKVWTSGAQHGDYGILLARTDQDQPKHRGITYFLIDMHQPGVEIRPLRQMTGASHFSEVFLNDARVPNANVLGEVNGGWRVAMTTLANERTLIGGGGNGPTFGDLVRLAREAGRQADSTVRQSLAAAYERFEVIRYLGMRVRTATDQGAQPGPEASVMKLLLAGHLKRLGDLALQIEGAAGMLFDDVGVSRSSPWHQQFLRAPSIRILGGSDEIQRNIIGERVLGLPPEPRFDREVPFRDLARNRAR